MSQWVSIFQLHCNNYTFITKCPVPLMVRRNQSASMGPLAKHVGRGTTVNNTRPQSVQANPNRFPPVTGSQAPGRVTTEWVTTLRTRQRHHYFLRSKDSLHGLQVRGSAPRAVSWLAPVTTVISCPLQVRARTDKWAPDRYRLRRRTFCWNSTKVGD